MNDEQRKAIIDAMEQIARVCGQIRGQLSVVENMLTVLRDNGLGLLAEEDGAPDKHSVPWYGQNVREVTTDDYSNSDCGPACVAMWLGYLGQSVTIDQVSKATGLSAGFTYTLPAHLITAAAAFGLKLQRHIGLTRQIIEAEIAAGNPLIVLVHYGSLPTRFSPTFKAGHWIIVTGEYDDGVTYNDPLSQDASGFDVRITWSDFLRAMGDCTIDGNTPLQGLLLTK